MRLLLVPVAAAVLCLDHHVVAQVCNALDDDTDGGLLIPAFSDGGNWTGLDRNGDRVWPEFNTSGMAIVYLFFLLYMFVGVGIVSDTFMEAIEHITSSTVTREIEIDHNPGNRQTVEIKVWNDTVANLTLMALGSSAPEILLSLIEITTGEFYSGDLGPSTIVGSAAFNLFIISAVCVAAIPAGEGRRIKELNVFLITASTSVIAYIWLFIILVVSSKDIVTLAEAIITLLLFPAMLITAYLADVGYFKKSSAVVPDDQTEADVLSEQGKTKKRGRGGQAVKVVMNGGKAVAFKPYEVAKLLMGTNPKGLSTEDAAELATYQLQKKEKKSRSYYRTNALRKMQGKKGRLATKPGPAKAADTAEVGFKTTSLRVREKDPVAAMTVSRKGSMSMAVSVDYATVQGTATEGADYEEQHGTLQFGVGETDKTIEVTIKDDDEEEDEEVFYVQLTNPVVVGDGQDTKVCRLEQSSDKCVVTIIDDDSAGRIEWAPTDIGDLTSEYHVTESSGQVVMKLWRRGGTKGDAKCVVNTKGGTATPGADFGELKDQVIEFKDGEMEKEIVISIVNDEAYERKEEFTVIVSDVEGCDLGGISIAKVVIENDDELKDILDAVSLVLHLNYDKYRQGTSTWVQKVKETLTLPAEKYSWGAVSWWISLPFNFFFCAIPPATVGGGWPCFVISLLFIGIITALIGDFANMLGCALGLKPSVTAITFVALGTSLPDTFASKTAAVMDDTADNSIGNVTGSNSVNVFLGLGLPWLLAAIYWEANWEDEKVDWAKKYPDLAADGVSGFAVPAGDLGLSVIVFSVCAVMTFVVFGLRRQYVGAELGVSHQKPTAFIFCVFWLIYVIISAAKAYGNI